MMQPDSYQVETGQALWRFLDSPLHELIGPAPGEDTETWLLALFRRAVRDVPAYRDFLDLHAVDPETVNTLADFHRLPLMTKPGYMQAYPLVRRCQGGSLISCDRVAVSSGSTGEPTFWPRSMRHELDIAVRFEQVFRDSFRAHERPTLAVVCFALGNWVGGLFTTSCCWHLARKGYPLLVATPGNNRDEIFRVIRNLAPEFEQTVLLGYPPFIKDVIDAGIAEGIDWQRFNVRMVFAGEVFSEEWRAELVRRAGSRSPCHDTASLYGTADGGVLGNESPFTIAARGFLAQHPDAARELFGESRLPTLVQYDPRSRYFEVHEDTLVVSGDSGIPLVRYHIADKGGVIEFDRMREFLGEHGADGWMNQALGQETPVRPLPLVFVFGRADFTVSFYGANIYPENVTVGLEQPEVMNWLTGKFVLEVRENPDGDRNLCVTVELRPEILPDEDKAARLAESIRTQLLRLNSEFGHYTPTEKQRPVVNLRPFGDTEYFPAGVKHRYTRR
jgi:phenylacetate-CoA ligase